MKATTTLRELLKDRVRGVALETVLYTAGFGLNIYRRETVAEALAEVREALCPWPALRLRDELWDTLAGQTFAACEWALYSGDAITLSEAARILHVSLPMVYYLTKGAKLGLYRKPDALLEGNSMNPRSGQPSKPWYMRRSEVEAYKERNT